MKQATIPHLNADSLLEKQTIGETFRRVWKEYRYLLFSAGIPMLLMALLYLALQIAKKGDGTVLVLDLNAQYVSFYEALRNFVRTGDTSLIYSFSRALGGEFMGIYAYYIASPFSYLVALAPDGCMQEALLCLFLFKVGLSGFTFGFYLHKTQEKLNHLSVIVFSILYALSAYAIVYQNNSMWIDALIWLPIISYGIEKLIRTGEFRLFVIFFSLTLMSNYYIGYMCCFYVLIYFFAYYFATSAGHKNNPLSEKHHFFKSLLRIGLWSVVSLGIACVILLTAYYSLGFGKSTFSTPKWEFSLTNDFLKMFTMFLPGSYDTVRPAGLPLIFCGSATLLLVPAYFISRKFDIREKIAYGAVTVFFFASFSVHVMDLVWHGFQKPNWMNYRYSFMLTFILLVMAYRAFSEIKSLRPGVLFGASAMWMGYVFFLQTCDYTNISPTRTILFSLLAIGIYLAVLGAAAVARGKYNRILCCVLLGCVIVETYLNGLCCIDGMNSDVGYSSHSRYSNFFTRMTPVVNRIQQADTSFYRTETTIERSNVSKDDNQTLMIHGLTDSTSTLNANNIRFLSRMGYASRSNWSKYVEGTPVNDSLFGIKYLITQNDYSSLYGDAWATDQITDTLTYYTYLNPNALPLAFASDSLIEQVDLTTYYNPMDRLNAIYTALLGSMELVEVFVPVYPQATQTTGLTRTTLKSGDIRYDGSSGKLTYTYVAPADGAYYFYLSESENCLITTYETAIRLNNAKNELEFNGNTSAKTLYLGTFSEGETITLAISPKNSRFCVMPDCANLYYVDQQQLEDACDELKEGAFLMNDSYTDTHLTGNITAKDDMMVFTSIPYDEGWMVQIDGKPVETKMILDNLMAFDIPEGEHSVELIYRPKALVIGFTFTVLFIVLFLLATAFRKQLMDIPVAGVFFAVKQGSFPVATDTPNESPADQDEES